MDRRILVVEDSPTQAERLRLLLEEEGYGVELATNGADGLERVRSAPPDLIISDVLMPEMDGYAFCHALKSDDATRRIPFIFFTEHQAPMDIIEGLLRGADNFIPKSSSDDYLLERVRRIFEHLEHRRENQLAIEILVRIGDRHIPLSADKQQIFELLISTLEETSRINDKLREAQRLLEEHARDLGRKVEERTRELRKAEERYHNVVEQANDGIFIADPLGTVVEVNREAERLLGLPRAEIVGRHFAEFVEVDERERALARFGRLPADGSARMDNRHLLRADGQLVPVDASAAVVETGGERFVVAIARDITERLRAEEVLRASEERYRELFQASPQPMWVFDLETLAFLDVNNAAIAHYGYSRAEFLAMSIEDIRPPEDVPAVWAAVRTGMEGIRKVGVFRHRKKDGTPIDVEISAHDLAFEGRQARLVLANDITERKRLEDQLRQAQKMEAVGQLAGGVAHDFNNLLGVITGYSELILRGMGPQDPGRQRAEQIQKAAERAAGLTRQLLAFSRRQVLQPRVLDLNAVVEDVERMLLRLIGENIQLSTAPTPGLGRVKADPGQIEQVVVNLAVNARDAMSKGGKLIIETANVDLDEAYARGHAEARPGPHVMLAVSDTGHGMDAETLSHIFEPFFTTKEEGKGTGLGLATVYGIVKQSGGHINVYSEPERGTSFKIYLPRTEGEERAEGAKAAAVEALLSGSETILVVEDAETLRVMIREILETSGYRVLDSAGPEAALAAARSHAGPVHLVLTDVVMPGMSARELAAGLGAIQPGLRVVYMSGYTDEAIGRHEILDPGSQFLQKPFTADALLRKVREVLDAAEP